MSAKAKCQKFFYTNPVEWFKRMETIFRKENIVLDVEKVDLLMEQLPVRIYLYLDECDWENESYEELKKQALSIL